MPIRAEHDKESASRRLVQDLTKSARDDELSRAGRRAGMYVCVELVEGVVKNVRVLADARPNLHNISTARCSQEVTVIGRAAGAGRARMGKNSD